MICTQENSDFFQKIEHSKRADFKLIILEIALAGSKLDMQVLHKGNTYQA